MLVKLNSILTSLFINVSLVVHEHDKVNFPLRFCVAQLPPSSFLLLLSSQTRLIFKIGLNVQTFPLEIVIFSSKTDVRKSPSGAAHESVRVRVREAGEGGGVRTRARALWSGYANKMR